MKPYKNLLFGLLTISLPLLASCEEDENIESTNWVLVWADEFDTPTPDNRPDPAKWTYETELQVMAIKNCRTTQTVWKTHLMPLLTALAASR